jgi:inorganic pyrophosphatase
MSNKYKDAIIEIPYNSFIKYEIDKSKNIIRCDRILNTSMVYPGNYGYFPNTLAGDGDPLDVLLISNYSLHPGIIIEVKIIGVLLMQDEDGQDEKIIAVPSNNVDINYININNLDDLPKSILSKIKHFFEHYKDNDSKKWCNVGDFKNAEFAEQLYIKYLKK